MQTMHKQECETNKEDKNKNISVFDNIYYISEYISELIIINNYLMKIFYVTS